MSVGPMASQLRRQTVVKNNSESGSPSRYRLDPDAPHAMDQELLSLFPSENEPPGERVEPRAAMGSSGSPRKARLRPATDSLHALDQHVQFLKARSHARALSESHRHAHIARANDATTPAEWSAGRAGFLLRPVGAAALLAGAVFAALAGVRFVPAVDRTPVQQRELLPTLASRTFVVSEPRVIQHISSVEVDRSAPSPSPSAIVAPLKTQFKGHLVIDSVPAGATVLINQRPAGTTPLQLMDYPAGSYAIWVERDGYERWTAGIRVQAGTTTHIRPMLSKPDQQNADSE